MPPVPTSAYGSDVIVILLFLLLFYFRKLALPATRLVFMCMVVFTVDHVAMVTTTGIYYRAIYTSHTKQVQEKQPLSRLQEHLHRCSIRSNCNYIVEDVKNAIKMYSTRSEIAYEEELLGIWMKMPSKF